MTSKHENALWVGWGGRPQTLSHAWMWKLQTNGFLVNVRGGNHDHLHSFGKRKRNIEKVQGGWRGTTVISCGGSSFRVHTPIYYMHHVHMSCFISFFWLPKVISVGRWVRSYIIDQDSVREVRPQENIINILSITSPDVKGITGAGASSLIQIPLTIEAKKREEKGTSYHVIPPQTNLTLKTPTLAKVLDKFVYVSLPCTVTITFSWD